MRYSIRLPDSPEGVPELLTADTLVAIAQAIEAAGLDACWVTDHPFPRVDPGRPGHHAFDPLVFLGAIATATTTLGLHTGVVVLPYRNPFLVANAANTVDHLSGGRLVLGVGSGYLEPEFAALGVRLDDRERLVGEALQALRDAWSGEPLHAQTAGWTATGNTLLPRPLSEPHPPVWMGGNSRKAIARAVTSCEGWIPFGVNAEYAEHTRTAHLGALEVIAGRLALARELCERHERTAALDVCMVHPPLTGAGVPFGLGEAALEELDALERQGVTWAALEFPATSRGELVEQISAWGELVAAHG